MITTAKPINDFSWPSWNDQVEALRDVDGKIESLRSSRATDVSPVELLLLPTGPLHQVGLRGRWGQAGIIPADRAEHPLSRASRT